MRKTTILVVLLLLSVGVFAQSIDQACYDSCKRNCLAQKVLSDECLVRCTKECTKLQLNTLITKPLLPARVADTVPKPVPAPEPDVTCDNWEALYKRCLSSSDVRACADKFSAWKERCQEAPETLSCEEQCRKSLSQGGALYTQASFMNCVADRCQGKPLTCEDKCTDSFANVPGRLKECLIGCAPKQLDCKEKCMVEFKGDDRAIEKCVQDRCVPKSGCRTRCQPIFDLCVSECEKPGCQKGCEDSCSGRYTECMRVSPDRAVCRSSLGDCLDACAGTVETPCRKGCREDKERCLAAGRSEDDCSSMARVCNGGCILNDRERQSSPQAEPVDCKGGCDNEHALCQSRVTVAGVTLNCDEKRSECYRVCDRESLASQPGLMSRVWSSVFG